MKYFNIITHHISLWNSFADLTLTAKPNIFFLPLWSKAHRPLEVLKVVKNFQYTDDFPPLMAHLHHFHPRRVWLKPPQAPPVSLLRAPRANNRRSLKNAGRRLLTDNRLVCSAACTACRRLLRLMHLLPSATYPALCSLNEQTPKRKHILRVKGQRLYHELKLLWLCWKAHTGKSLLRSSDFATGSSGSAVRYRRLSNLGWFALTLVLEKRSGYNDRSLKKGWAEKFGGGGSWLEGIQWE